LPLPVVALLDDELLAEAAGLLELELADGALVAEPHAASSVTAPTPATIL
jgi:hypothetical protein